MSQSKVIISFTCAIVEIKWLQCLIQFWRTVDIGISVLQVNDGLVLVDDDCWCLLSVTLLLNIIEVYFFDLGTNAVIIKISEILRPKRIKFIRLRKLIMVQVHNGRAWADVLF